MSSARHLTGAAETSPSHVSHFSQTKTRPEKGKNTPTLKTHTDSTFIARKIGSYNCYYCTTFTSGSVRQAWMARARQATRATSGSRATRNAHAGEVISLTMRLSCVQPLRPGASELVTAWAPTRTCMWTAERIGSHSTPSYSRRHSHSQDGHNPAWPGRLASITGCSIS